MAFLKEAGKTALKIFWGLLALVAVFIGYLWITEYRPEPAEDILVEGQGAESALRKNVPLRLLTWNLGYCSLGAETDFFMDGGEGVYTTEREQVVKNLEAMMAEIGEQEPDIFLLQEVDMLSWRSHGFKQYDLLQEQFPEFACSFAYNFKVAFLPYPVPPLGRVESGLATFSAVRPSEASRISLPVPFRWPVRMVNMKRGLLISRFPIEGSEAELVVINLHLEAYDDGEGKIEQTKMLERILQEEARKGNYVVAGGDFNQIFSHIDKSLYPLREGMWAPGEIHEEELGGGFTCLMDPSVPTCRSLDKPYQGADKETFQYYMIDGYIVSSGIEVLEIATIDKGFESSDHNPVLLEIRLKETEE